MKGTSKGDQALLYRGYNGSTEQSLFKWREGEKSSFKTKILDYTVLTENWKFSAQSYPTPANFHCSHLNRVAIVQCIQLQSSAHVSVDELCPHVIFWKAVIHTEVLNPGGKALIEPQVSPPLLLRQTFIQFYTRMKLTCLSQRS